MFFTLENEFFMLEAAASDSYWCTGEDFTTRMVMGCLSEIRVRHGHRRDQTTNPRAIQRLRAACEQVKRALSSQRCAMYA